MFLHGVPARRRRLPELRLTLNHQVFLQPEGAKLQKKHFWDGAPWKERLFIAGYRTIPNHLSLAAKKPATSLPPWITLSITTAASMEQILRICGESGHRSGRPGYSIRFRCQEALALDACTAPSKLSAYRAPSGVSSCLKYTKTSPRSSNSAVLWA